MVEEHSWRLKHVNTPLYDLPLTLRIDRDQRRVEIEAWGFDSYLVGGFVVNTLPLYGVHAYFDSADDPSTVASWDFVYVLCDHKFHCDVGRIAVLTRHADGVVRYEKQLTCVLCEFKKSR